MKLSIIIVSYNVSAYLRQCIQSILDSSNFGQYEIIVVDNDSYDNSCTMIKKEFPNIKLIQNSINMGFSKAVNKGISISKGDYICLLNPDTLISSDTFNTLLQYFKDNKNIGAIGPKILNPDGSLQLACKRSFPSLSSIIYKIFGLSKIFFKNKYFGKYNLTYLNENDIHSIDCISGSCMLFPKDVVNKIGLLDETFFMYGEDIDFCYRLKKFGYQIIYNPHTSIIHYKGESGKNAPFDLINIFYKALFKFYKKYENEYPSSKFINILILTSIQLRKIVSYCKIYLYRVIGILLDLLSIVFASIVSIYFWYSYYYNDNVNLSFITNHKYLILNFIISWFFISYLVKLYKHSSLSYTRAIIATFLSFFLSASSTYFISFIAYSRAVLIITFFLLFLVVSSWRIAIHILYRYRKISLPSNNPLFTRRAVIVGSNEESVKIGELLNNSLDSYFLLLGYVCGKNSNTKVNLMGHLKDLNGLIKKFNINEIIIPENYFKINDFIKLVKNISSSNIAFKIVPKGDTLLIGKGSVENLSGVALLDVELPLFEKFHIFMKRSFDLFFASVLIFITLPLHVYYYLTKKYYFDKIWYLKNGQIELKRYKSKNIIIKNLYLLIMVFKGKFSFVGSKIVRIVNDDPNLILKPGITGLPHMKNPNYNYDYNKKYQTYYAMNYSLIFDIEIIFKSIFKI